MSGQERQLEIKKMKQGMSYSCKEKTIILNVFKYFRSQFPDKCVTDIVRRTSKATGCSEKSIFQFRKEESSAEGFKTPSKTKIRKNININSRDIKYDTTVRQSIRDIIQDLKNKNVMPSLNTILKQVKADASMPNFSLMTLRRLLFDMGFCYEKNGSKPVLVDKQHQGDTKSSVKNQIPNVNNKKTIVTSQLQQQQQDSLSRQELNNVESENNVISEALQNQTNYISSTSSSAALNEHKFFYMPQTETYMMPAPPIHDTHNMQMMLNMKSEIMPIHAIQTNLQVKREIPPWIHSHNHNYMVKQQ